jgi:Phosphotransferase enzyme family
MPERDQLVLEAVARLLYELAGARIGDVTNLGNTTAPVLRIVLDTSYEAIGRTVIAKTRPHPGAGWNTHPAYLENERRALEHLQRSGVRFAPRVLADDASLGILVMTDLGTGPSVEELLLDPRRSIREFATPAEPALVAMARAAGTVHAARGRETFRAARRVPFLDDPMASWGELRTAAEDLGFPRPTGVSADVEALAGALADERFRGFAHGDLTPGNALLIDGEARLFDFEGAGVRHIGIDAACLRLSFPQYRHWAALPTRVQSAMDRAYRAELAKGFPAVADDSAYGRLLVEGCLAWAVVRASRLRLIASGDQGSAQMVRRRTQIVHTLTSAIGTAEPTGHFPALTAWLGDLVDGMKARWYEARLEPRGFTGLERC